MTPFAIARESGLSDAEVITAQVCLAEPGDLLTYQKLSAALGKGTDRKYSTTAVQAAVGRAERKLATEHSRALVNIRGSGYRVALAAEHQLLAVRKRDRAGSLLKRGVMILQHVDWGSMDENTRRAHEGQLMVMGALHTAMSGIDRRLSKIESALQSRNDQE